MRICWLLAGVAVVTAPTAFAQAADDFGDTIIVTALGGARGSDEMIASTTALNGDAIVDRLAGGLGDTLAGLPGVSSTSFGPGASRPVLRGLGAERVQVLTNGIGVIDASAASPDHAVTADPLGASRIEILRGPAALAYGGGATGGVINVIDGLIVDRLPSRPASAKLYAGANSADEGAEASAAVTGAAGPLVASAILSRRTANDLRIPGASRSARQRLLDQEAGETVEAEDGLLANSGVDLTSLAAGLSWVGDRAFAGIAVRDLDTGYGIVGEVDEAPAIDLNQRRYDLRAGLKLEGGPIDRLTVSGSTVDYTHTEFEEPGVAGSRFFSDGWEARGELHHAPVMGLTGTIGVQASRRTLEAEGEEAFITPTETSQTGLFLFESIELGDVGFEGGMRFDKVELDNLVAGERSFELLNASFGVHGHVVEPLFLGASVSLTERAPIDVELFADGPHLATGQFEVGDPDLDTEQGVSFEATARLNQGPFTASVTAFHFDFDRFIYLAATGDEEDELPVFESRQAGAKFTGGELEASLDLGQLAGVTWVVDGSVDYVRASIDDAGAAPRIPPLSASLGVEGGYGGSTLRVSAEWAADQDRVAANELPTDSWLTIGALLTVPLREGLDLIVEGRNLTDEEVRVHASPLKDVAPQTARTFRIGVRGAF